MSEALSVSPRSCADICAIITTYRPDDGFPERVQRVRPQVGGIVIVDDGDSADNVARLRQWFPESSGVTLHHNLTNAGVGAALNTGIAIAQRGGYRWVLTLDDDTSIFPDMLTGLIEAWKTVMRQGGKPVAALCMANVGAGAVRLPSGPLLVEKRGVITSGSLIPLDVVETIGGFREEFFIDSVDYDYCLRARSRGYRVLKVNRIGALHHLGNEHRHQLGPFAVVTTHHTPLRRYYAVRNSTVLMREHFRDDPLYSLAVISFHLRTVALVLLFERDKQEKLRWMGRGFIDAFRNRLGKRIQNGAE